MKNSAIKDAFDLAIKARNLPRARDLASKCKGTERLNWFEKIVESAIEQGNYYFMREAIPFTGKRSPSTDQLKRCLSSAIKYQDLLSVIRCLKELGQNMDMRLWRMALEGTEFHFLLHSLDYQNLISFFTSDKTSPFNLESDIKLMFYKSFLHSCKTGASSKTAGNPEQLTIDELAMV